WFAWTTLAALISYPLVAVCLKVVYQVWWMPRRIDNHFRRQGISGPAYRLFLGNLKEVASLNLKASSQSMAFSHNILPRVLSFYHHWKKIYGSVFLIWFGRTPRLTISDPALIREIFIVKSDLFEKNESPPLVRKIEGDGLLSLEGEKWAHHRRIIQPTFHAENLKLMIPTMAMSIEGAVAKWSEKFDGAGKVEVEVCQWFESLVEEVITRATFGNSCYEEGRAIFDLQSQQMLNATGAYLTVFIPGFRFLPTRKNRLAWRLEREIRESLLRLIERRRRMNASCQTALSGECPSDLLDVMMRSSGGGGGGGVGDEWRMTADEVVEECKTLFFAGKHTTANLLTWTTVLLGMHPQWQEQAREEVLRVCGSRDTPTKDDLAKLKTV
ncbi:hypothetical protein M569_16461, partial [Genlisea aurea]